QFVGIFWIDDQVYYAGAVVDKQCSFPGLSPVRTLEDPAVRILRVQRPDRSYPNDVVVFWMNDDAADVLCFGQAEVSPRLTPVGRLIYPRSRITRTATVFFACTHI